MDKKKIFSFILFVVAFAIYYYYSHRNDDKIREQQRLEQQQHFEYILEQNENAKKYLNYKEQDYSKLFKDTDTSKNENKLKK